MSKMHDNDFRLNMVGMTNFSFTSSPSDYHVTTGQRWGGITSRSDKKGAVITVKAGRDSDGTPGAATADWFINAIGQGSAIGCQTTSKLPGGLNFAFKGTMTFDHGGRSYQGKDIVIAQGHTAGLRNNWWLGGPRAMPLIDLPIGILSVLYQSFGALKDVSFMVAAGDVSSMSMGIVSIK